MKDFDHQVKYQRAIDAWHYLQNIFDPFPAGLMHRPDRHYASLMQADDHKTFTFTYDARIDLLKLEAQNAWCTYVPEVLSNHPTTMYMVALFDKTGKSLEPGRVHKVDVRAHLPVKHFWALTGYDRPTFSFIYSDSNRTTLSSYDVDKMKKNADAA